MHYCIVGLCLGVALVAAFPNGSPLGFLGFLVFLGSALGLVVLFVRSIVRSVRHGNWHAGQLLAGVLIVLLVSFVVQRLSSPDESREIERTLGIVATTDDLRYCDQLTTKRYLEQVTGVEAPFADELCEYEAASGGADSIEVSEIAIVAGRAEAMVHNDGGSLDGSTLAVSLVEEAGDWKLDRIDGFQHFDRTRFRQAYRRKLIELGSTPAEAECVLAGEQRLSRPEVERAVLHPADDIFAALVVDCDRAGVEGEIAEAIADPILDLPRAGTECAERRLRTASDAELVQLRFDLLTYNQLVFACARGPTLARHRRSLVRESDFDPAVATCVVAALRRRPTRETILLTYDEDRYAQLVETCERER